MQKSLTLCKKIAESLVLSIICCMFVVRKRRRKRDKRILLSSVGFPFGRRFSIFHSSLYNMKTEKQQRIAAAAFAKRWEGRGYEKGESQSRRHCSILGMAW